MSLHIALYQPEIPPNTGNIIRLCANTATHLHLIEPFGFAWEDKALRRAGLDYHEWADIQHYQDAMHFIEAHAHRRIIACSTKASTQHHAFAYQSEDILLFGPESRGLPENLRTPPNIYEAIRIPMAEKSRSINLANSVSIILYEALRQLDFPNLH
jgi:tRNA (cytidine/uridine-2'-O-)-methyltransferase